MPKKFSLDSLGLVVTAPECCTPVIERLVEGILLLLQFDGNPAGCYDEVISAASQSPDEPPCIIALCAKVQLFASVMLQMDTSALKAIVDDPRLRACYEPWEIQHARMVIAFAAHQFSDAMLLGEEALVMMPGDIFTTRALFVSYFLSSSMERMRRHLVGLVHYYKQRQPALRRVLPYVMGFAAFALEETGNTSAALAMAEASLQLVQRLNDTSVEECPAERRFVHPYGMHVVAHCYVAWHDPQGGLDAVARIPADLWVPTQHLVVHCWWHMALFEYDLGRADAALRLYDEKMLPHVVKDDPYALSDASALLFRLYVDDILPRGDARLPPLTEKWAHWVRAEESVPRPTFPFSFFDYHLRMHQAMTCAAECVNSVNRDALLFRQVCDGSEAPHRGGFVAQRAVLDAVRAFCSGEHELAAAIMEDARGAFSELGGSNAQRDMLVRATWYFHRCAAQDLSARGDQQAARRAVANILLDLHGLSVAFPRQPHHKVIAVQFESLLLN